MTKMHSLACWSIAVLTLAGCHGGLRQPEEQTMATPQETGFLARTIELDGETYRYAVYVPHDYTPQKQWPIVLFLHGAGERGADGMRQTTVGIGKAIRENPERFGCIVVMPQCRPSRMWQGSMIDLGLATLDQETKAFNIDSERVVLTGLSLGGFGTWAIGAQQPDRFSCLAPVCGGGDESTVAAADKLATVPIWCFHGADDPVVPAQRSRELVDAVRAEGGDVRYSEYPNVGHNSWDNAYGDAEAIAWMLSQKR